MVENEDAGMRSLSRWFVEVGANGGSAVREFDFDKLSRRGTPDQASNKNKERKAAHGVPLCLFLNGHNLTIIQAFKKRRCGCPNVRLWL